MMFYSGRFSKRPESRKKYVVFSTPFDKKISKLKTMISNIPSKDRLNWIKANSKVLMELLLSLPPPTMPAAAETSPTTKSINDTSTKQSSLLPDIELPKFSTPDISGLSRVFKLITILKK